MQYMYLWKDKPVQCGYLWKEKACVVWISMEVEGMCCVDNYGKINQCKVDIYGTRRLMQCRYLFKEKTSTA